MTWISSYTFLAVHYVQCFFHLRKVFGKDKVRWENTGHAGHTSENAGQHAGQMHVYPLIYTPRSPRVGRLDLRPHPGVKFQVID